MPIKSCGCDEDTKKFAMQYFWINQILINEECDMQRFVGQIKIFYSLNNFFSLRVSKKMVIYKPKYKVN
jgi:hypothetical protein